MNRDPGIYGENAAHSDPARHLEAGGDIAPGISVAREEGHVSYGFGRRLCVGRHLANNTLFISIAIVLWAAKIGRKKDESGEFRVDGFMDHGIVVLAVLSYERRC
jgi:cytochrome P450